MNYSQFTQQKLGFFDTHTDIGNCQHSGFASYNPLNQTYTLGGSGSNIDLDQAGFHYAWTTLQGDFILRAEAHFIGKGSSQRSLGWMVKNDLDAHTEYANAGIYGDGKAILQCRKQIGEASEKIIAENTSPQVLQLERRGNTFIMSTSQFGQPFSEVQLDAIAMDREVFLGLYVCAHKEDEVEIGTFRNVRIIKPVDPDFEAYEDYIGSHLEVMEIATGHRKILYSSSHSIQAPNWTLDGKRLLYNSKGRLFYYHLPTQHITPIDTGFAIDNNNDHVLSFDGKWLGISHHYPDENRTSCIYTMNPEGDSAPTPVTFPEVGASYLHGWSPDNRHMVYTAERKGQFDIYKIEIKSGQEIQLTNQETLDDGPEYSPDGKHIFFNSARTGKMKIWRMEANGQEQVQLTFDEYNDWFPHISPDKKWIVFISYPEDIKPSDHPFYQHCLLRIMPYEGGEPKVIGYLYGGQGTINVPSWSPDSQYIAFVSNSDF